MSLLRRLSNIEDALRAVELPPKTLPFVEWKPDTSNLDTTGVSRARNTIPVPGGLGPLKGLVAQTNALDDVCKGGIALDDGSGVWLFVAGDASKLYIGAGGTFTDASKPGGYAVPTEDYWKFVDWGEYVIATNIADPVQFATAKAGETFADAITSARKPQAKYAAVMANRLVLGNTFDALDDAQPRRIWWSALDNFQDFEPSVETGADYVDRKEGGVITGLSGGLEFGMAFQTQQILRLDPTGGTPAFQIEPIDKRRGCPYPNTIVSYGRRRFFLSEDGVHYNDGSDSVNVSYGKVTDQIFRTLDTNRANEMSVSIDRRNNLFVLGVPQNRSPAKRLFILNLQDGRWSEGELDIQMLIEFRKQGYTLDGMTPDYPSIDDDVPYSLDDPFWKGGDLESGAFDGENKLSTFTGPNLQANIVTKYFIGGELQNQSSLTEAWPLIHGQQLASVRHARRVTLTNENVVGVPEIYGPYIPLSNGRAHFVTQNEGRYHQIELFFASGANWDKCEGIQAHLARVGGRIG